MLFTICAAKKTPLLALVDGNNFYVSCERVFNPKLEKKPIVVLSNNDGCAIARSNEAKMLGIPMGAPFHTIKHFCKEKNLVALSSNFELYGDMSARLMDILKTFALDQEVYSIDECFLSLPNLKRESLENLCLQIYKTIAKQLGLPITIGVGITKTLAKAANRLAKQHKHPFDLQLNTRVDKQKLHFLPVDDVWGIGRNLSPKLRARGIYTAYDLAQQDARAIHQRFNVVTERVVRELQGFPCSYLEHEEKDRKNMQVTRSFPKRLTLFADISEAVANHAARLAEKLHQRQLLTPQISVYCRTSPFKKPYYKGIGYVGFIKPTDDTQSIINAAINALGQAYRKGLDYQKVGVMAIDLINNKQPLHQTETFLDIETYKNLATPEKQQKLNHCYDSINQRFGKRSLIWGSEGMNPKFLIQRNAVTPAYTTKWQDLLRV